MSPPKHRDVDSDNAPIEELTQSCPLARFDLRYQRCNGDGVPGAKYHLFSVDATGSPDGVYDKRGELNGQGRACLKDVPEITGSRFYFESDPTPYEPYPIPERSDAEQNAKARSFVDEAGAWIWGTIQGDFNKDPTITQIAINTVAGLIPLVDQVLDVRDIAAGSKDLIDFYREDEDAQKKHEDVLGISHETFLWVNVFLIALGCIPILGSALKGLGKSLVMWLKRFGKTAGELSPSQLRHVWEMLVATLNNFGIGNAHKFLKDAVDSLSGHLDTAADILKKAFVELKRFMEKIRDVAKKFSFGGSEKIIEAADDMAQATGKAIEKLEDQKQAVNQWMNTQFKAVIPAAHKFEAPAGGAGKVVRAQQVFDPDLVTRLARSQGVSEETILALIEIADKHNVIIKMRPTTKHAQELLEKGTHLPKPSAIKAKTINAEDLLLGAKGQLGEVAVFKPHKPTPKQMKENPALERRYRERMSAWAADQDLRHGRRKPFYVDKNGVVRSTEHNKAFTGDNDIYSMTNPDGSELTKKQNKEILGDLEKDPINAQHGAHADWEPETNNDKRIKQKIDNSHTAPSTDDPPGTKKEPLVVYSPGKQPSQGYSNK